MMRDRAKVERVRWKAPMRLRLIHDRVLVKLDAQKMSQGGIIIPETARGKPTSGTVVAVGPECTLKIGERVSFGKYNGFQVDHVRSLNLDGEHYVMREGSDGDNHFGDVYGVIER